LEWNGPLVRMRGGDDSLSNKHGGVDCAPFCISAGQSKCKSWAVPFGGFYSDTGRVRRKLFGSLILTAVAMAGREMKGRCRNNRDFQIT
jgi:hypothetical protein